MPLAQSRRDFYAMVLTVLKKCRQMSDTIRMSCHSFHFMHMSGTLVCNCEKNKYVFDLKPPLLIAGLSILQIMIFQDDAIP